MTGVLGGLGAPRQRSASNLSVARQARPSGSVMKNHSTRLVQCPAFWAVLSLRTRSVYGSVGWDGCIW